MQKVYPVEPSEDDRNKDKLDYKSQISVLIENIENNSEISYPQVKYGRSNNYHKRRPDIRSTRNNLLTNKSSGSGSGESN